MGTTAEAIVQKYKISREDQDEFAYNSHMKAIKAIDNGIFKDDIIPYNVTETFLDSSERKTTRHMFLIQTKVLERTQQKKTS